jgi:DNA-binding transcriptional MocR family regulator
MALKGAIMDADIYGHRQEIRLDERQLRLAVGVSRTSIREAMTLLEQEGFLRTVPRPGIFIVWKTKKEIIEIIEVCAALASMAARLATTSTSRAVISRRCSGLGDAGDICGVSAPRTVRWPSTKKGEAIKGKDSPVRFARRAGIRPRWRGVACAHRSQFRRSL